MLITVITISMKQSYKLRTFPCKSVLTVISEKVLQHRISAFGFSLQDINFLELEIVLEESKKKISRVDVTLSFQLRNETWPPLWSCRYHPTRGQTRGPNKKWCHVFYRVKTWQARPAVKPFVKENNESKSAKSSYSNLSRIKYT